MYKAALLSLAGAALAFAFSPACVRWLHGLLSSRSPPLPDDAVADVAIVLGYALFRNGSLTEPLKSRVRAGVDAFLQGRARHLLFSGSHPGGSVVRRTEANVMREYAEGLMRQLQEQPLTQGRDGYPGAKAAAVAEHHAEAMPTDRWYEEDESTSTYENAVFSMKICRRKGWRTLLVVTSPFHQLRSELVFRRLLAEMEAEAEGTARGLRQAAGNGDGERAIKLYIWRAEVAPHTGYWPPAADRLVDLWDWARELLALVYYFVKGRL